ncbi:MAG: dynamin family protein [Candidatus Acidiferrales bacterium]
MTEDNFNSSSRAAALNEFQAQRLRVTCQYIDKLLGEIENILNSAASKAAFPRYSPDVAPGQRRTIEHYIARVRAQLLRVLDGQGIPAAEASIPASRAIHVNLGAVDIAVEELKPKYMRGFGDVPETVATELNGIVGELATLVRSLDRYLAQGVDQDLKGRLDRLERAGGDLRLLEKIERIVRERGLVEFRPAIAAILDRAQDSTFEIAVFGRVSAGKSSLLNAIIETDVLPVGVTPVTAVPTRIVHAAAASLAVWFAEAPAKTLEIARLAEFATEQQNAGNVKHVTRIVVALPSPRLSGGVAFVDTPGLGSLVTNGAAETLAYLPKCDLGVVLMDAGSALTADDLQTILALQRAGIPVNVLLAKADLLSVADRARIIQYARQHILSECKIDLPVRAVSVIPSYREMTDQWFQEEILPLYQHSQQLREASLRRKIAVLSESVAAALQATLQSGAQSSANTQERARSAEALLRRTTGQIDEMRALCERQIAGAAEQTPDAIRAAAGELLAAWPESGRGQDACGKLVRDSLAHFVQQNVRRLQDDLATLASQLQRDLRQSASDLGLVDTPAEGEFHSVIRGTPLFDPQPLQIVLSRPRIAALFGRRFAERQLAGDIRTQLGQPSNDSLNAYWKLLNEWSASILRQLRQRFETYAENHRVQAQRALGGIKFSAEERDAVQNDLAQLTENAVQEDVRATVTSNAPEARSQTTSRV